MSEAHEPPFEDQQETGEWDEAEGLDVHSETEEQPDVTPPRLAALTPGSKRRVRRTVLEPAPKQSFTPEQRLLILDSWQRSGLPATDFAPLVGISNHTLYAWRKRFDELGPAGLDDKQRGAPQGSRINEPTRRAILMMKRSNPDWGCDRIHDMLHRTEGYRASSSAIQRVLQEEGYVVEGEPTRPHPDKVRSFERAKPNQMWQTDLFTFVLKRENRRVHLVGFMDDHSRFVVGFGLHASASGAMVRESFEAAIANYGAPEEILTDNGAQYHTWRGKSAFAKLCEKRGIKQIVARPRHPQTLGKIERFWGTLWRECLETAIFRGLDDARERIRHFVDHYNFQRTHQGIDGAAPADRFFSAAPEVRKTLNERVEANAIDLARHGTPRKPFYLTGRVGDASISLHGEGDKVILTSDGKREEVDLSATGRRQHPEHSVVGSESEPEDSPSSACGVLAGTQSKSNSRQDQAEDTPNHAPGTSPLDDALLQLRELRYGNDGQQHATDDGTDEEQA
ncbi:MAG: IS481 family transposase [Planctomycetes bacterium]|nr:IS481 family transposase [Planctomycetota bacterium]